MNVRKISHNGTVKWEVRFRVYTEGQNPKRVSRWFDRKTDAEKYLDEQKELQKKSSIDPAYRNSFEGKKFIEEAEYWLTHNKLKFSAGHLKRVEGVLREILPSMGSINALKINAEFLSNFQIQQSNLGKKKATINRKTEIICGILNFSAEHRRIPYYPANAFRKFDTSGEEEMCFWEMHEAQDFLAFTGEKYPFGTSKRWVHVAYLTALNTAVRGGELWGIAPQSLPIDGGRILIRRQFNRITHDLTATKGKTGRVVPCNQELEKELRALIVQGNIKPHETIFMNEQRNPICHDNFVKRKFQNDIEDWGGRKIRFHDLRHTATTLLIANGIDLKTVKEICGHADIKTTMRYAHLIGSKIMSVAKDFSITGKKGEEKLNSITSG